MKSVTKIIASVVAVATMLLQVPQISASVGGVFASHPNVSALLGGVAAILALLHNPQASQ